MSAASDARRDLVRKLALENQLKRDLNKINNKIVDGTIRRFNDSGLAYDASLAEEDLTNVLNDHYENTSDVFSDQISSVLPSDIAVTAAETALVQTALAGYFVARAVEQAQIITATNQRNISDSIQGAGETRDEQGEPLSRRDQAREAGARTSRKLKQRQQGIATTETQQAAEVSKATEAEILVGKQASIIAGSPIFASVPKEWVTVGDEKVRFAHVRADSQTVDLSKPFTVGGELLRYPGDTSLGASAGNVINCRCSSIYQAESVFAVRRKRKQDPFIETEPSEQLRESIGL